MPDVDMTVHSIAQARYLLGRLREALGWLDELYVPGPRTARLRALSPEQQEYLKRLAEDERVDRANRVRPGRTPGDDLLSRAPAGQTALAPARPPLRLGITAVQVSIHDTLRAVCSTVAEHAEATYLGRNGIYPGTVAAMEWLGGHTVGVPSGLDLLGHLPPIPRVDRLPRDELAAWVVQQLDRADELARNAADCPDIDREHLDTPCPVHGHRTLYADHTSKELREWYVICEHRVRDEQTGRWVWACRCTGTGCRCGRPYRVGGERHVWIGGEWLGRLDYLAADDSGQGCPCVCHIGGYARPDCDVLGGCGSIGCDGHGRIVARAAA
jgi:hypothetical protein